MSDVIADEFKELYHYFKVRYRIERDERRRLRYHLHRLTQLIDAGGTMLSELSELGRLILGEPWVDDFPRDDPSRILSASVDPKLFFNSPEITVAAPPLSAQIVAAVAERVKHLGVPVKIFGEPPPANQPALPDADAAILVPCVSDSPTG